MGLRALHRQCILIDMKTTTNKAARNIRFHVLDADDKWLATRYAATEVEAIQWALSEGLDAWSARDSISPSGW